MTSKDVVQGPWWTPTLAVERLMTRCKARDNDSSTIEVEARMLEGLCWDSLKWREERAKPPMRQDETTGELERLRMLQEKALALDDAVAEFGIDKPQYIAEVYQAFHDVLHDGHGAMHAVEPTRNQADPAPSDAASRAPTPRGSLPNSLGTGGAGSHPAASSSEKASDQTGGDPECFGSAGAPRSEEEYRARMGLLPKADEGQT